jgi:alpha-L-fucosidase 2
MTVSPQRPLPQALPWPIPARTPHDGLPLGNALFGALLWGEGNRLQMTINRSDYWDHRGGITFGAEATYENLRRWLAEGNEAELRRVFEGTAEEGAGTPPRPSRLPMGRVDVQLGEGLALRDGWLSLAQGTADLSLAGASPVTVQALVPRGRPLLALRLKGVDAATVRPVSCPPTADEVLAYYRAYGFPPAEVVEGSFSGGWYQALPADPGLYVGWVLVAGQGQCTDLVVAAAYGADRDEARRNAQAELDWALEQGYEALAESEAAWWRRYWRQSPWVTVPDATLQEAYALGMTKLAGIAAPGAPAVTLQGPWVEEYRLPPWQCDYHLNINVQECYWPAYPGNHLEMLGPLFDLIASWEPRLREIPREFLGLEDGLMVHHAVDDRCTCMGGFWTGAIDHGSTGWVAHMMWQYYLYTLDTDFLRRTAFPFMRDTLRVYEAMLEERPDGTLTLPVSVSPEYEGSAMWAWGANASFQLAIIRFLCRALLRSAAILGVSEDVCRWQQITERLPIGSLAGEGSQRELVLWDGQPLAHSHRHHSHMAALYPFDVVDYWNSADDRTLLENTARTWTRLGMGEWTGWCLPWAAILWARMGNGERAALLLEEHRRVYTGPGKYTTHDAVLAGFSVFDRRPDIMQIEAAMGAATAVMEMLAYTASGVLRVFPAVPARWQEAAFDGIRAEGAFLVSAERRDGRTHWVRVYSERGATLRLAHPFGEGDALVTSNAPGRTPQRLEGAAILTVPTSPDEEVLITPCPR